MFRLTIQLKRRGQREDVQPWHGVRRATHDHSPSSTLATCHLAPTASSPHLTAENPAEMYHLAQGVFLLFLRDASIHCPVWKREFSHKESRSHTSCFWGDNSVLSTVTPPEECEAGNEYLLRCQQLLVTGRFDFLRLPSCPM